MNVDQAIRISAIEANKAAAGKVRGLDRRALQGKEENTHEELVQTLMTLLDGMERRQSRMRLGVGWVQSDEGVWIPPGWVREADGPQGVLKAGPANRNRPAHLEGTG